MEAAASQEHRAESHGAIARRLWDGIAQADLATLEAVLDPKTVWRVYGSSPFAGVHVGVDAVLAFLAHVGELADELNSTLLDVFVGERGAVLRYSVHARRGDSHLEIEQLFLARIEAGRVVEAIFSTPDQERYDRFWLDS
jgi:ketosteroid isomerase-like protein